MKSLLAKVGLKIGLIQRTPCNQTPERKVDQRLKDIRNFDEWLSYIKETDPQAFQELIDLGREPIKRSR